MEGGGRDTDDEGGALTLDGVVLETLVEVMKGRISDTGVNNSCARCVREGLVAGVTGEEDKGLPPPAPFAGIFAWEP